MTRRRTTRRRMAGVFALVAVAVAGCATDGLAFREDDRIEILRPDDREVVELPVRLEWRAELDAGPDGGPYFAVFVDRAPIRPGQSLAVLADDSCEETDNCPDLQYLRDRAVYVTDEPEVTLDVLPRASSSQRTGARDRHEATVVVIDAEGRRVGESAHVVEFEVGEG